MTEKSGVSWSTLAVGAVILCIVGGVIWFGATIIGAIQGL